MTSRAHDNQMYSCRLLFVDRLFPAHTAIQQIKTHKMKHEKKASFAIRSGDNILLRLPTGEIRSVKLDKDSCVYYDIIYNDC